MMARGHVVVAAVICTTGCAYDAAPDASVAFEVRDSAGISIVLSHRPSLAGAWTVDDSATLRIGHEPGRPEYELYRVTGAIQLSDGRLVIGNAGTSEIRWYSESGAFLRASGGEGDGPGEFRYMERIIPLPGDSIAAGDYALNRFSVYDAEGDFVRTVTQRAVEGELVSVVTRFLDGTSLWSSSGIILAADGPTRLERLRMNVYRIGSNGGSSEAVASLPWVENAIGPSGGVRPDGSEVIGRSPRVFGRSSWIVADSEGWIFADNALPEIRDHAIDGRLTRIIRWPIVPRLVTEDDIERDWEWTVSRRSWAPEMRERVRRAREALPPPPDTMPWFGCPTTSCTGRPLILDADRNLWVRAYRPPADAVPDRYDAFDSAGVWLGSVTMPDGLEVLSIATDHVIGLLRDDLGVESVAVHRLAKN
jgi:hypothetical protein